MGRIADARGRLPEAEDEEKDAGARVGRLTALVPEVEAAGRIAAAGRAALGRGGRGLASTRSSDSRASCRPWRTSSASPGKGKRRQAAVREAAASAKAAEERRRAAEAEAAAAEKKAGGRERLDEAASLIVQRDHEISAAEGCRARAEAAESDVAVGGPGRGDRVGGGSGAEPARSRTPRKRVLLAPRAHAVAEAEAALEEAVHGDMAAELRAGLATGRTLPGVRPAGRRPCRRRGRAPRRPPPRRRRWTGHGRPRRSAGPPRTVRARAVAAATERAGASRETLVAARATPEEERDRARARRTARAGADRAPARRPAGHGRPRRGAGRAGERPLRPRAKRFKEAEERGARGRRRPDAARERADQLRDEVAGRRGSTERRVGAPRGEPHDRADAGRTPGGVSRRRQPAAVGARGGRRPPATPRRRRSGRRRPRSTRSHRERGRGVRPPVRGRRSPRPRRRTAPPRRGSRSSGASCRASARWRPA